MLHGREHDCAALSEMLSRAQLGSSSALVLRGEAGIGKTALLDWLSAQAEERSMSVLRCAGVESETGLPFAGLHQLVQPVLHALPALPRLQQEALRGALGLSGRRSVDPFLVAVATLSLLGELAGSEGVACVIDDAQWLDQSSADALRFVARRLHAEGTAFVFAVRETDSRDFMTPGLDQRYLTGLDIEAAASLLLESAPNASAEVRERLVTDLAGNPLAIIELSPLLSDEQLAGSEPLPEHMPMGGEVERLYAARAAALSSPAQHLLLLAATADTDDVRLVISAAEALQIPASSVDEAEASGLITTSRGMVQFKHPLVRSAVYLQAGFLERQRAHRAMADLLVNEADVDRRAWHLARAATGLDDDLADLLERSADRALARGGPASAADRWQWSADFSSSGEDKSRRLMRAADSALMAAQPGRARHLLALAEPLLSTPRQRGRARGLLGAIEMRHGAPEAAYNLLLSAARDLAADDPTAALESLVLAGEGATFIGDPRLTSEVGKLAQTLGDLGSDDAESRVALLIGLGKLFEGNWSEGARILAGVVDESVLGDDYASVLRSGRAAMYLGRLSEARGMYDKAVQHARSTSTGGQLTIMLDRLSYIDLLLGRLSDAEAHATEGLRLADDLGLDSGIALTSLAMVHAYRGDEEECRAQAERAQGLRVARQLRMIGAAAHWALGVLELGAGRPAEALTALTLVASEAEGHPGILRWATPDLVEAAARSGSPAVATPAMARLEAWAQASDLAIPQAALSRCRGLMSSGEEGIAHFQKALEYDGRDSRPLERARIELLLGESLRRQRQRSLARVHLRNALQTFERLTAHPWVERARVELRASGESTPRKDPSNFEQLTPQELQIAQYAADGESNSEIAAKLFLSRRTVEYHLAKVFTKLGVTSRHALASVTLSST